ncbi:MAG: calcium/sodium antiporter [Pseudomonadota bacterium]
MTTTLLLLATGLLALLSGGEFTVRGAAGLSRAFGIPPFVIGLTIVAFGTSSPELVVNLIGAYSGESAIAFGNVIGSNLANIGLVLALSAMLASVHVQGSMLRREVPLLLLVTFVLFITVIDPWLRDSPAIIDRSDALVLLTLFLLFIYITINDVVGPSAEDPLLRAIEGRDGQDPSGPVIDAEEVEDAVVAAEIIEEQQPQVFRDVALTIAGLVLLIVGGQLTVEHASTLAASAGISSAAIGIGVVAVGTSLPELITSGIAALRNEPDLAVGNVIGSNLFNTTFVLGISALAIPLPVPEHGEWDMLVNLLLVGVLVPFVVTGPRQLARLEGFALLAAYVAYLTWRFNV